MAGPSETKKFQECLYVAAIKLRFGSHSTISTCSRMPAHRVEATPVIVQQSTHPIVQEDKPISQNDGQWCWTIEHGSLVSSRLLLVSKTNIALNHVVKLALNFRQRGPLDSQIKINAERLPLILNLLRVTPDSHHLSRFHEPDPPSDPHASNSIFESRAARNYRTQAQMYLLSALSRNERWLAIYSWHRRVRQSPKR